ncbi:Os01g0318900 [Oryza sativa Japonica Group]|uniref:Os01g0318900 protein n=1 Tax=Oryza sativa subsp. japonica TaxID=39947 RepID=A0A0P0V288_ORYSJ|nr:Os01g0318900 [Oryza sativa Japonica Group]
MLGRCHRARLHLLREHHPRATATSPPRLSAPPASISARTNCHCDRRRLRLAASARAPLPPPRCERRPARGQAGPPGRRLRDHLTPPLPPPLPGAAPAPPRCSGLFSPSTRCLPAEVELLSRAVAEWWSEDDGCIWLALPPLPAISLASTIEEIKERGRDAEPNVQLTPVAARTGTSSPTPRPKGASAAATAFGRSASA